MTKNNENLKVGQIIVKVDSKYFRPAEVETLLGDSSKAKKDLGWVPKISVKEMCQEMVREDLNSAMKKAVLKREGFNISISKE